MWREELAGLAGAIRAHPRFFEAVRRFMAEFVEWRARLGVLNKVGSNLGRERLLEYVLYLHFARAGDNSEGGATFERLAALSDSRDQIGARAVRTALRLAQIAGLVSVAKSATDGRMRIITPADSLMELARQHLTITFRILDALAPEARFTARFYDVPDFLPALLTRIGRAYIDGDYQRNLPASAFTSLLRLEGSRVILSYVVDCHWDGRDLPPPQEFFRRFYISPSQTRAVLKSADAHGLVHVGPRGRLSGADALAEAYVDALSRFLAFALRFGFGFDGAILPPAFASVRSAHVQKTQGE